MRRIARGLLIAGLFAAGCDVPQEASDQATCTTLCQCLVSLPSARAECEAGCLANLAPVPEVCELCVLDHADRCESMITDCSAACQSTTPTP
ncbi:MAG TPA: hypothetical protein VM513_03850 [Kofleriaceae bacterium]|jgi:hypothetical protein|nr:hypothetical protein [Kofleriaceae bacterium]